MPTSVRFMLREMDPKDRQGRAGRRVAVAIAIGVVVLVAALLAGAGWTVALSLSWVLSTVAISMWGT